MGRRALRQGGGDGGAQLRHVNTRRTEEPADREGFIFPENPREKKPGSKTHIIIFAPRDASLDVRHNHSITTLLHYSITHTTVYRYREEESRG